MDMELTSSEHTPPGARFPGGAIPAIRWRTDPTAHSAKEVGAVNAGLFNADI